MAVVYTDCNLLAYFIPVKSYTILFFCAGLSSNFKWHSHHPFSAHRTRTFHTCRGRGRLMFSRPASSTTTSRFGGARTSSASSTSSSATAGAYTTTSMRAKSSLAAPTASSAARRAVTDENRVPSYARPTRSTAAAAALNHADVEMKDVSAPSATAAAGRARTMQTGLAAGRPAYSRPILREHTTNVPAARTTTTGTLYISAMLGGSIRVLNL